MNLTIGVDHLKGDLRMSEDEVEDRIPRTDRRYLVNTLIEERHDTDLLFEVFFSILLLIQLGVGTRKGHLHISHTGSHHHLIGESHQSDTNPDDDDREEDIDDILSNIHETLPERRPE